MPGVRRDARQFVKNRKEAALDPILARMILSRAVVHDGITDGRKHEILQETLCVLLRDHIDDDVVEMILREDVEDVVPTTTPAKWQTMISSNQTIDSALRELIEAAHESDTPKPLIRRKVMLCRHLLIDLINSPDFHEIVRTEVTANGRPMPLHPAPKRMTRAWVMKSNKLRRIK